MFSIPYSSNPSIAVLIRETALDKKAIRDHYITPTGIDEGEFIAVSLEYLVKKPTTPNQRKYLNLVLPKLGALGVRTLVCADANYFKTLTKVTKAEANLGDVLPCKLEGHESMQVLYAPNYQSFFHNPANEDKLALSRKALSDYISGSYQKVGSDVLREVYYVHDTGEIAYWLEKLKKYPTLACDIEAFSLKHYDAGIATISFSWDRHSAVVLCIDAEPSAEYEYTVWDKKDKKNKTRIGHIKQGNNTAAKLLLRSFFETYTGAHIWHNASYDVYVLIYELFMDSLVDREGLLNGLDVMLKYAEDSQLVTFLATNTCAGNVLGLKENAQEFVGNYAIEVTDIRTQTLPDLMKYNAIDTCATFFVWEKHYPTMVQDKQEPVYTDHFKPYLADVIDMQLTGACIDPKAVQTAKVALGQVVTDALHAMNSHPTMQAFLLNHRAALHEADYQSRKSKAKHPDNIKYKDLSHFDGEDFNPNSPSQLQAFLFDTLGLPVLDRTATKQPSTKTKVLIRTQELQTDPDMVELLQYLIDYKGVSKLLSSFIPALEQAVMAEDGAYYIYGSFKLGGTLSGRMSSSNPNLQNTPSGSTWAKYVKDCFIAPPGYIFVGIDSASLEDRIDTLLTRDPNKVKIYTDGYDGHCYRAFYYFGEKMPDIYQIPEGVRAFTANVGGTDICFSADDTIHYEGQQYTGVEFYEKITNTGV